MDILNFARGVSALGVPVAVRSLPAEWTEGQIEVRVVISAGSREDPPGKEGLAHATEHMYGQGTRLLPSEDEIDELDADFFLGTLNAHTRFDYTTFSAAVDLGSLPEAMHHLKDIVFHPLLEAAPFEEEKCAIVEEIWEDVEDKRTETLRRKTFAEIYGGHPFHRMNSYLGWAGSVHALSIDDVRSFHRDYYHLGNIKLVFAGNISLSHALHMADLFAAGSPRDKELSPPAPLTTAPGPLQTKRWARRDVEQTEITVYRLLPHLPPQSVWLLRHLLRDLLRPVRSELAASYGADVEKAHFRDHHLITIRTKTNARRSRRVEEFIRETLDAFSDAGAHEARFEAVKQRMLRRKLALSRDRLADLAAKDLGRHGQIISLEDTRNFLYPLAYEEFRASIAPELTADKLYWLIVEP